MASLIGVPIPVNSVVSPEQRKTKEIFYYFNLIKLYISIHCVIKGVKYSPVAMTVSYLIEINTCIILYSVFYKYHHAVFMTLS